jgi:hypothetical protein
MPVGEGQDVVLDPSGAARDGVSRGSRAERSERRVAVLQPPLIQRLEPGRPEALAAFVVLVFPSDLTAAGWVA